jgi:hypothetical protein
MQLKYSKNSNETKHFKTLFFQYSNRIQESPSDPQFLHDYFSQYAKSLRNIDILVFKSLIDNGIKGFMNKSIICGDKI